MTGRKVAWDKGAPCHPGFMPSPSLYRALPAYQSGSGGRG